MKLCHIDELDPATFIVPIVVVDISDKAKSDPNAVVDPDDLVAFERGHGRIPKGACVAMNVAKVSPTLTFPVLVLKPSNGCWKNGIYPAHFLHLAAAQRAALFRSLSDLVDRGAQTFRLEDRMS